MKTLKQRLADALGVPFGVEKCHALNDASAHALAVAFDDSRRVDERPRDQQWRVGLVLRVGGGIGACTIILAPYSDAKLSFIDSKLIEGTHGLAGELGHLPIGRRLVEDLNDNDESECGSLVDMDYDKWRCSCNNLHHLEAFASATAVARRLKESGIQHLNDGESRTGLLRYALEQEEDACVIQASRDAGRMLGRALAGPILMLDPYSITLTGSLANEHLVDGIGREKDMWSKTIDHAIKVTHLGGDFGAYAGVQGAALAVIRKHVYRDYLEKRARSVETFKFSGEDLERLITNN